MSFIKKLFGQPASSQQDEAKREGVPVYKITTKDGVEVDRQQVIFTPPVEKFKPPIVSDKTFKKLTILGIECTQKDEKLLMQRVNDFLALFDRKIGTMKNAQTIAFELPFVIKYFYWNQNKSAATSFDIKRNEDLNANWYFPEFKQCAWVLSVRIDHSGWERIGEMSDAKLQETHDFLNGLLDALQFNTVHIFETDNLMWLEKVRDKVEPYKNLAVCSSVIERYKNG